MSTPALLALDPDSRVIVLGAPGFVQVHRVNGWPAWNVLYSADAVGDCGEPLYEVPADDLHGDADLDGWMDCCPELAYTSDDCDGAPDFEPVHERERTGKWAGYDGDCEGRPVDTSPRCGLVGPYYTPCTYADCDVELGGGCVLRGPPA